MLSMNHTSGNQFLVQLRARVRACVCVCAIIIIILLSRTQFLHSSSVLCYWQDGTATTIAYQRLASIIFLLSKMHSNNYY